MTSYCKKCKTKHIHREGTIFAWSSLDLVVCICIKCKEETIQDINMIVRYDMRMVYEMGINIHPQRHMKDLGFNYINSTSEPMGDCWFFELEKKPVFLPEFLTKSNYTFD